MRIHAYVFLLLVLVSARCPGPAIYYFPGGELDLPLEVAIIGYDPIDGEVGDGPFIIDVVEPGACRYYGRAYEGYIYNRYSGGTVWVGPAVRGGGFTTADCEELY